MRIIRKIAASLSMYSKIPMPFFKLEDEDFENVVIFLPLAGAVIAVLILAVKYVMTALGCPDISVICAIILVPLAVTGGFHIDGFLDTVDALRSYRSKERKLEILSDPHIGSFAVISLVTAGLFAICALSVLTGYEKTNGIVMIRSICAVFVISRIFTAFVSIYMPKAISDDMLVQETKSSGISSYVFLMIQLVAVTAYVAYTEGYTAFVLLAAFIVFTVIFRHIMMKNFGGVTGDMAGYYVTAGEVFAMCVLAVTAMISYALTLNG